MSKLASASSPTHILVGVVRRISEGNRLLIRLAEDDLRYIRWADIVHASPAADTPTPTPRVSPIPSAADDPDEPFGDIGAEVQIDGMQKGMTIQEKGGRDHWESRCQWPCESVKLRLSSTHRLLQSDGLSHEFELPFEPRMKLLVEPGARLRRKVGIGLLSAGAVFFTGGLVSLLVGLSRLVNPTMPGSQSGQITTEVVLGIGGSTLGIGVPMLTAGIVLAVKGSVRLTFQLPTETGR